MVNHGNSNQFFCIVCSFPSAFSINISLFLTKVVISSLLAPLKFKIWVLKGHASTLTIDHVDDPYFAICKQNCLIGSLSRA